MRFGGKLETVTDPVEPAVYRWDAETDILSCALTPPEGTRGFTGSIELEDSRGAVVTLDVEAGSLLAVEVVVWPERTVVPELAGPAPQRTARLTVPARPSQPGVGVLEVDVQMLVETSKDEAVIHIALSGGAPHEAVSLAGNLMVELDAEEELVGFWFLHVPPFDDES
jgi:hypothetical protein